MWQSFKQIIGIIATLVLILMLPVFVQTYSQRSNKINQSPSISESGVSTSNVLGVSDSIFEEDKFTFSDLFKYKKYAIYIVEILFVISILSFIRFKYLKDKYGIK